MEQVNPHPDHTTAPPWTRLRIAGAVCWINPRRVQAMRLDGEHELTPLLDTVARGTFEPEHIYKADRRSIVQRFTYGGRRWVVKEYRGGSLKRWVYHQARRSTAWREWAAANRLDRIGIRTVRPLALLHRGGPWGCTQTLLLPHVQGVTLQQYLRDDTPPDRWSEEDRRRRRRVAETVGRQVGLLIAAGIVNRDHKTGNLLIDDRCIHEAAQPVLIDPAGLRRRRNDPHVWRMLARLLSTATEAGPVTPRECLVCLREALRTDSALAAGKPRRLKSAARSVDLTRPLAE